MRSNVDSWVPPEDPPLSPQAARPAVRQTLRNILVRLRLCMVPSQPRSSLPMRPWPIQRRFWRGGSPADVTPSVDAAIKMVAAASAAMLLALLAGPPPARAHNQPPPIELWGPFLPATQSCLRRISDATHACFD